MGFRSKSGTKTTTHEHKWVVRGFQNYETPIFQAYGDGVRSTWLDATRILRRCECGGFDVEKIDGAWTAEQLGLDV